MFESTNTESPRTLSMSGVSRRIEEVAVALRPYLPFVHVAMALAFVVLIAAPVLLPASEIAREMGQTARFLIWTLWFPLVFLSVLVTGRLWCGVLCPMGAASEWMNGIGLKRKVPAWLRWEGTPIVEFSDRDDPRPDRRRARLSIGDPRSLRHHAARGAGGRLFLWPGSEQARVVSARLPDRAAARRVLPPRAG